MPCSVLADPLHHDIVPRRAGRELGVDQGQDQAALSFQVRKPHDAARRVLQ